MDPKNQPQSDFTNDRADLNKPSPVPPPEPLPEQPDAPVVSKDIDSQNISQPSQGSLTTSQSAQTAAVIPEATALTTIPKIGLPNITLNSLTLGIGAAAIFLIGIIVGLIF